MNKLPDYVSLMDTTLRDGEQTQGVSFAAEEKLNIAQALLEALRVDRIEVASARVSEGEKEAVRSINEWAGQNSYLDKVEVLGFVDHTLSIDWIMDCGGRVLNLLTKGSENHCHNQLGKTLEQHAEDIKKTVVYAKENGIKVNAYLEDWSNGYKDNKDYVFGLMSLIKDSGIEHFMLPDTLGVMSPTEVTAALKDMQTHFPDELFDFHPHNDYGLAVANCMAAVESGVSNLHCTVNCLGERAGNVSLAELAVVLKDKLGVETAIDETHLAYVSKMVESFSGKWLSGNAPIIGEDVFTQTSGIHADGDVKGGLYETKLSPERFDRRRTYALGKLSGKASVLKNIEELGISLSAENLKKVLDRVVKLGDSKEVITADDLPFIIADVLESSDYHHIRLLDCQINSTFGDESEVKLSVNINGADYEDIGHGNGGFSAFMDALKKIMQGLDFTMPELVDYAVRIPNGGKAGALTECTITWDVEGSRGRDLRTRGVYANQVYAAVIATLRMVNTQLHNN
ncbi:MAG: alpha-isopropylmalate synthase regulatory domain-containing protein [Gammaproteobacteria bacterium]|jgi:(R)-citramalate synthase|nr:alpha-isopropylmalate synthase regulatory domain-containing protein [Gammaproteobacteria bacterium]